MMKYVFLFVFILSSISAQICRYRDRVFSSIAWQNDVIYATAPQITPIYISEATTTNTDLKIDIAMPIGDSETNRPLIITAHPGGFFSGSKESQEMTALCDTFAHHGYVACTMNYRLFLNITSSTSAERAVYRAVQDIDALIRFFAENHTLYGIDTNHIYFIGSSAGSFAGLHHVFMDDDERPSSSFSATLQPDLGCKSCSGNNFNHQAHIKALVSGWGAIGDTNWIENSNNTSVLLFHGTNDIIVPYNYGFPFTVGATMPAVYGSSLIHDRMQNLGLNVIYHEESGEPHEYWGTLNGVFAPSPSSYWPTMVSQINQFFFDNLSYNPCTIGIQNNVEDDFTYTIHNQTLFLSDIYACEIFSIDGKLMTKNQSSSIDLSSLNRGIYILNIHKDSFHKIIKIIL